MDVEDESYQQWLADTARACRNCPRCCDCPCGGCTQGGVCDDMRCRCDDDPEDEDE